MGPAFTHMGVNMEKTECQHDFKYWGHATHPTENGTDTITLYKCDVCGEMKGTAGDTDSTVQELAKALMLNQKMYGMKGKGVPYASAVR